MFDGPRPSKFQRAADYLVARFEKNDLQYFHKKLSDETKEMVHRYDRPDVKIELDWLNDTVTWLNENGVTDIMFKLKSTMYLQTVKLIENEFIKVGAANKVSKYKILLQTLLKAMLTFVQSLTMALSEVKRTIKPMTKPVLTA